MDITLNQFNNILDYNMFNMSRGKGDFRIFYHNIRSLKKKIDEVEILVKNLECDLVILSETWINETEKQYCNISNYNPTFSCRKRQGGGLGLFSHSSLDHQIIDNYESENHACIIMKIDKLKIIVIATYRPPSFSINDFLQFLDEKISSVLILNYKCLIIGDMNINLLDKNNITTRIIDVYRSNNFHLCNSRYATRHSDNNHSLLDHVAVNFTEKVSLSIISNCLSDHDIQIIDITSSNQYSPKKTVEKTILRINYKLLDEKLASMEEKLNGDFNTNEIYNTLVNNFSTCIQEKTIKIKEQSKPWFNENLYYLIRQRDYYFQRKKLYPNNKYIKNMYDKCSKMVKKNIKTTKRNFYKNMLDNTNSKSVWKAINFAIYSKCDYKLNEIKTLYKENTTITDSKEICELFNDFFINVGQNLANKIPKSDKEYAEKVLKNSINLELTNEIEIQSIIANLNSKKATGYDKISVNMIKKRKNQLSKILTKIINRSLSTGTIPDNAKIAKIIPIFKSGNKQIVTNYRPISVLPVISKIIEKVMLQRLQNFLQKYDFFIQINTALEKTVTVKQLF